MPAVLNHPRGYGRGYGFDDERVENAVALARSEVNVQLCFAWVLCAAVCLCFCLPAAAQSTGQDGVHTHDGFMLRLGLGFGYGSESRKGEDFTVSYSGVAGLFDLAIGWTLFECFGVHLSAWDWAAGDATRSNDHDPSVTGYSVGVVAGGAGVTYFLMPWSAYLSASVGVGDLRLENADGDKVAMTSPWPAVHAVVGKEWWVSANWGLGAALAADYSVLKDQHADSPWTGYSLGLLLSATYN